MPKHHEQHNGDGTMDLYGYDFACTFRVPRESVLHLPAQRLNITRLVACKNFSTAVVEASGARVNDEQWCANACKMGNRCKFVHVSRPLSEFPSQALHAHYIWRSVEDVAYERLWNAEKEVTTDVPRLVLHACAICTSEIDVSYNTLIAEASVAGKQGGGSTDGSRNSSVNKAILRGESAAQKDTAAAANCCRQEGSVNEDSGAATEARLTPDSGARPTQDGLLLDVVAATLSTLEIPATRFLKTFGATRALNSIREAQERGLPPQQQYLETCYLYACDNECKDGPDCEKAHVINIDPSMEAPFVRRSTRHVKAAVINMRRGPPHGGLKPASDVVARLIQNHCVLTSEDIKLASDANESDPAAYPQPPPKAVESQCNPLRSSKTSNSLRNAKAQSTAKTSRGEAPQYAPYPTNMFMSPNPLQSLMSGGCDFVVAPTPQHFVNQPGTGYPAQQQQQLYHHTALPTHIYTNPTTNPTTPTPQLGGAMCLQYPSYMLTDPLPMPPTPEQYHDAGRDNHMKRLVDDVIGAPTQLQHQHNNNSNIADGNAQQQRWSPFNSNLNWQQQVPQLAHTIQSSNTNNMMMQAQYQQQATGFTMQQQPQYAQPQPPQQQQQQAMMYSLPFPFNSGGQMQFASNNNNPVGVANSGMNYGSMINTSASAAPMMMTTDGFRPLQFGK